MLMKVLDKLYIRNSDIILYEQRIFADVYTIWVCILVVFLV